MVVCVNQSDEIGVEKIQDVMSRVLVVVVTLEVTDLGVGLKESPVVAGSLKESLVAVLRESLVAGTLKESPVLAMWVLLALEVLMELLIVASEEFLHAE